MEAVSHLPPFDIDFIYFWPTKCSRFSAATKTAHNRKTNHKHPRGSRILGYCIFGGDNGWYVHFTAHCHSPK